MVVIVALLFALSCHFQEEALFGEEIYDECFEGINLAVLALDHGVEA